MTHSCFQPHNSDDTIHCCAAVQWLFWSVCDCRATRVSLIALVQSTPLFSLHLLCCQHLCVLTHRLSPLTFHCFIKWFTSLGHPKLQSLTRHIFNRLPSKKKTWNLRHGSSAASTEATRVSASHLWATLIKLSHWHLNRGAITENPLCICAV